MLYDIGLEYRRQIIWNYENGWSRSKKTLATHYEPLLWFSKGSGYTYHVIREPYKSVERLKNKITKNGKVWTPHPDGRMAGDVWRFPTLAGARFASERVSHPTQKPMSITDRIVKHFSNPGDLVVVPFLGSGTECVSAARHGRHYWGCDIKPEFVELAMKRLASPEAHPERADPAN
jgi:DNA modification methylase